MSTHNICFGLEIRKILFSYTLLSGGLILIVIEAAILAGTSIGVGYKSEENSLDCSLDPHVRLHYFEEVNSIHPIEGAEWLSGRVLDSRHWGHVFMPRRCHCVCP